MGRNEGEEETGESLCHGASGKGLIILVDYRQLASATWFENYQR